MSSLIANKVQTNMYLVSIKLFVFLTNLCTTVQTYTTYTTIITTITLNSLSLSASNLSVSGNLNSFELQTSNTLLVLTQS